MRAIPSSGTSPLASYKELSHRGYDRTRIFHILISLRYHNTTIPIQQKSEKFKYLNYYSKLSFLTVTVNNRWS